MKLRGVAGEDTEMVEKGFQPSEKKEEGEIDRRSRNKSLNTARGKKKRKNSFATEDRYLLGSHRARGCISFRKEEESRA